MKEHPVATRENYTVGRLYCLPKVGHISPTILARMPRLLYQSSYALYYCQYYEILKNNILFYKTTDFFSYKKWTGSPRRIVYGLR